MGYKLICIDMDGTLLNSNKEITETTKEALLKASELGVRIVISTGRKYADVEYYSNLIGIKSPLITANGAYVKEKESAAALSQCMLGEALVLKILEICNKYHVSPCFHTSQKEYCGDLCFHLMSSFVRWRQRLKQRMMVVKRNYIATDKQWRIMIANEKDQLLKCVIFQINKTKIRKIRDELMSTNELEVVSSTPFNLELTHKGVSKGNGVEVVARYYGLKKEEIIAIGDSENDLTMIEYAGLGVAMGNAMAIVKEKADYITDTNDRDGVAKVIQKFVLNG